MLQYHGWRETDHPQALEQAGIHDNALNCYINVHLTYFRRLHNQPSEIIPEHKAIIPVDCHQAPIPQSIRLSQPQTNLPDWLQKRGRTAFPLIHPVTEERIHPSQETPKVKTTQHTNRPTTYQMLLTFHQQRIILLEIERSKQPELFIKILQLLYLAAIQRE